MWRWLRQWRDWAMNEIWTPRRIASQASALYFRSEKAGLILDNQPIPWNAEAVLVEALLLLPANARKKNEYTLHLPNQPVIPAEALRRDESSKRHHLFFRIPAPKITTIAELYWRHHLLGKLELTVLTEDQFLRELRLFHASVFIEIAGKNLAAQTFLATQCKKLFTCAILRSPTGLAPLLDTGLKIQFRNEVAGDFEELPVSFVTSQLAGRETMVSVPLPKKPRRMGEWTIQWLAADKVLFTQRIRGISKRQFLNSLRLLDTRFLIKKIKGELEVVRQLPSLSEVQQAGPCFFLASREPGMAGQLDVSVTVQIPGAIQPPMVYQQTIIVTDGPTAITPGLLEISELSQLTSFELHSGKRALGLLPLSPVPTATFNAEGGYKPPPDFTWSNIAEDELSDRLNKLMDIERGTTPKDGL